MGHSPGRALLGHFFDRKMGIFSTIFLARSGSGQGWSFFSQKSWKISWFLTEKWPKWVKTACIWFFRFVGTYVHFWAKMTKNGSFWPKMGLYETAQRERGVIFLRGNFGLKMAKIDQGAIFKSEQCNLWLLSLKIVGLAKKRVEGCQKITGFFVKIWQTRIEFFGEIPVLKKTRCVCCLFDPFSQKIVKSDFANPLLKYFLRFLVQNDRYKWGKLIPKMTKNRPETQSHIGGAIWGAVIINLRLPYCGDAVCRSCEWATTHVQCEHGEKWWVFDQNFRLFPFPAQFCRAKLSGKGEKAKILAAFLERPAVASFRFTKTPKSKILVFLLPIVRVLGQKWTHFTKWLLLVAKMAVFGPKNGQNMAHHVRLADTCSEPAKGYAPHTWVSPFWAKMAIKGPFLAFYARHAF